MPLSKLGKKMKRILIREYGREKGLRIFYAMEHKHPEWRLKKKKGRGWFGESERHSKARKKAKK